jgi:hypothetical protein
MRENYETKILNFISDDIQKGCSKEELLKHRKKLYRMSSEFLYDDDYITKLKLLKIIKELLEE